MHFKKKPIFLKKNKKLYYEENLKNQTSNTRKCCLFLASANWQNLNLIFVLFHYNLQIQIQMDKLWKTEVHAEKKPLQDKIDKQYGLHCPSVVV